MLRKEWKEVARLSAELSAREPKNADGAYWQGVAALNLGQLDVAIEQLTRSLTLEERTKGHFNLGMALAMRGEVEKALPHFQRSVAMSPKYEPGWQAVAQAQLQLGDALTAGESVLRALELSPGDPELLRSGCASPTPSARSGSRPRRCGITSAAPSSRRAEMPPRRSPSSRRRSRSPPSSPTATTTSG